MLQAWEYVHMYCVHVWMSVCTRAFISVRVYMCKLLQVYAIYTCHWIYTITKVISTSRRIKIGFYPLINKFYEFVVFDFHTFFDGIVGTEIIFRTKFNLISGERILQIRCDSGHIKNVPLKFCHPTATKRQTVLNAEKYWIKL